MKKLIVTAIFAIVVAVSGPAMAREESEADCAALFATVDTNHDGFLVRAEKPTYFEALEKAGMMSVDVNKDGKLNAAEFISACVKDVFKDLH